MNLKYKFDAQIVKSLDLTDRKVNDQYKTLN